MRKAKIWLTLALGLGTYLMAGCQAVPATPVPTPVTLSPTSIAPTPTPVTLPPTSTAPAPPPGIDEQLVIAIPLTQPLAGQNAEVSGMAWFGDALILLPQYPHRMSNDDDGALFGLARADILAYLDGTTGEPLDPLPIPFHAPGLSARIDGFEGYEAIAFAGERVFLTIEAAGPPRGYLVAGTIAADLSGLTLDVTTLVELPAQSNSTNKSDEAILVIGDMILTIYEVNGAGLNPSPLARAFDFNLNSLGTIPFPNVEYRVTDVVEPDEDGYFWAINYFYPGDTDLSVEADPLVEQYGLGPTHAQYEQVERLVAFQYDGERIVLVDTYPIYLELVDEARNWEGLVRLDTRGFLLATDKFPETILAFVPGPWR
jgi:hypothetical protein